MISEFFHAVKHTFREEWDRAYAKDLASGAGPVLGSCRWATSWRL